MGIIYKNGTYYGGGSGGGQTIGVGGGYAPIGTIISYMGTTAPQDYLACDGSTYNIADYQQLATFFATQFGSSNFFGGDGVTTFKVPDLRGEFLRGTGTNSHSDGGNGATVGTHQGGTSMPTIWTASGLVGALNNPSNIGQVANADKYITGATKNGSVSLNQSDQIGTFSSIVRPTNTSILWCIKAIDAGEVYSTEERVVGTWIDGKPLYQKTYIFTGSFSNDLTLGTYDTNYNIHKYYGIAIESNGGVDSIPSLNVKYPSANFGLVFYNGNIFMRSSTNTWIRVELTTQYTKTTDV